MRGLFPTCNTKYGVRSQARKEIILQALAKEEEAELIKSAILFNADTYGSKINTGNSYKEFADKQKDLFKEYNDKYLLVHENYDNKRDALVSATLTLIDTFKYMKSSGKLDDIKKQLQQAKKLRGKGKRHVSNKR